MPQVPQSVHLQEAFSAALSNRQVRRLTCIISLILCTGILAGAQDPLPLQESDLKFVDSQKGFKQGLYVIPLPVLSYSSDLGLQYGAYVDMYDYGREPSIFPRYFHHFHVEASHYTKGQTFVYGEYESEFLIPGVRFITSLTWQNDPLYQFYGFNGSVTPYDRTLDRREGVAYYCYRRDMLRFLASFQGRLGRNWGWMAALNMRRIRSGDLDFDAYDSSNTLFHKYTGEGLIHEDELSGALCEFLGGVKYDTRDFEPDPSSGVWGELYLNGSPDLFSTGYPYLKAALRWRHYITPGPTWLTLAYHLGYQTTLLGNPPFYVEQNISTIQVRQGCAEGLGGINTLRGVLGNRLVGDAYAWANFEIRLRILQFNLAGIDFAVSLNPFFDTGMIVKPFRLADSQELLRLARILHCSAGTGLKLGMDSNFMMSVEWGMPFRSDDGRSSLYFALNYIF